MKAWLKGGVIGALLYFFIQFIDDFFYVFYRTIPLQTVRYYLYLDFLSLDSWVLQCYSWMDICRVVHIVLLGFIAGALIGGILGAIASPKKKGKKIVREIKPLNKEELVKKIDKQKQKISSFNAALAKEAEIKRKKEQNPEKIKKEIEVLLKELKKVKEEKERKAKERKKEAQKAKRKEERIRKREEQRRAKEEEKAKKEKKKKDREKRKPTKVNKLKKGRGKRKNDGKTSSKARGLQTLYKKLDYRWSF